MVHMAFDMVKEASKPPIPPPYPRTLRPKSSRNEASNNRNRNNSNSVDLESEVKFVQVNADSPRCTPTTNYSAHDVTDCMKSSGEERMQIVEVEKHSRRAYEIKADETLNQSGAWEDSDSDCSDLILQSEILRDNGPQNDANTAEFSIQNLDYIPVISPTPSQGTLLDIRSLSQEREASASPAWSSCTRDVIRTRLGFTELSLEDISSDFEQHNARGGVIGRILMNNSARSSIDEAELKYLEWALDTYPFEKSRCETFEDYEKYIYRHIHDAKKDPVIRDWSPTDRNDEDLVKCKNGSSSLQLPQIARCKSRIPVPRSRSNSLTRSKSALPKLANSNNRMTARKDSKLSKEGGKSKRSSNRAKSRLTYPLINTSKLSPRPVTGYTDSNHCAETMMPSIMTSSECNTYPRTPKKRGRKKSLPRNRSSEVEKHDRSGWIKPKKQPWWRPFLAQLDEMRDFFIDHPDADPRDVYQTGILSSLTSELSGLCQKVL